MRLVNDVVVFGCVCFLYLLGKIKQSEIEKYSIAVGKSLIGWLDALGEERGAEGSEVFLFMKTLYVE